MSSKAWIEQEEKRIGNYVTCVGATITTIHGLQSQRIFSEGLNGNGTAIGQYNTTEELYVNPKNTPKALPTKGKTGQSVFKNGKPHKTTWYESYKSLRSRQGRRDDRVNLNLSGLLFRDYSTPPERSGNSYLVGVRNKANSDKIDGIIENYGKVVFELTESESKLLQEVKC